jgi:hypothetical protein
MAFGIVVRRVLKNRRAIVVNVVGDEFGIIRPPRGVTMFPVRVR